MTDIDECDIMKIVTDIESGDLSVVQIVQKHNITKYKYNQILKLCDIKKPYVQNHENRKPKITKFKKLLVESEMNMDDSSFDLEGFKKDCSNGMRISELMQKYKLSLYQIRELRKRYDLKTK